MFSRRSTSRIQAPHRVILLAAAFGVAGMTASGVVHGQADAPPASAMEKSGVLGTIRIAERLLDQKRRVIPERAYRLEERTWRVRRPSTRGPLAPVTEPMPAIRVLLEGATPPEDLEPVVLKIADDGFQPQQALRCAPGVVTIENTSTNTWSLVDANKKDLGQVPAGGKLDLKLAEGVTEVRVLEIPNAHAKLRVLTAALPLKWNAKNGKLPATVVAPGDYKLGVYLGAELLGQHAVSVPRAAAAILDVSVSEREVATIHVKRGARAEAVRSAPIVPRPVIPPPPRPETTPEPESGAGMAEQ